MLTLTGNDDRPDNGQPGPRIPRFARLALACLPLLSTACLQTTTKPCASIRCPPGLACLAGGDEEPRCVKADICGNELVETGRGEACDDGNLDNGDGCNDACQLEGCGNGVKDDGEVCDDGNTANGDGCSADCRSDETCGNGMVDRDVGEVCDDGKREDGDGCSGNCLSDETCGNGYTDFLEGEECDEGPDGDSATCDVDCSAVVCGDGHVNVVAGETCDDVGESPTCDADCSAVACGDGYVNGSAGEPCEPGEDIWTSAGTVACTDTCQVSTQLAAGENHTCALLPTGTVRCWGVGDDGRLGYGNTDTIGDNETPASAGDVDVGSAVKQLVAGESHTCALLANGAVRCWGDGYPGKLGYSNTSDIGDNEAPASAGDVHVGDSVVQLAAGGDHTCALLASRDIRCWGEGHYGQLGYGNTNDIGDDETPASVGDSLVGSKAQQVVAGGNHTCALLETGAVRCWGRGSLGQLGYGNTNDIGDDEAPVLAGDVELGGTARRLAAGQGHTCALLDTGAVRCWGYGGYGELGYGNTDNIGDNETPALAGDIDIGGPAVQITAGDDHTCALLDTGAVRCWGRNFNGYLGYGHNDSIGDDETPADAGDIDLGGPVVQVVAGGLHTCALLANDAVRCWGYGPQGQLGYGVSATIGNDETPASAGAVDAGGPVEQIAAGRYHTCALLDAGHVRCWGDGPRGQLGYGTIQNIEIPANAGDVTLGATVEQLSAGTEHTCALLSTGAVRCWGYGGFGQLGYGNTTSIGDNEHPASAGDVAVGGVVTQIVASSYHTCALLATGTVRCWGYNNHGQLGYGNTILIGGNEDPASAGDVAVSGVVTQIAAGSFHTCALRDTGAVSCWGIGVGGRLGYGNTDDIGDDETPVSVGDVAVGDSVTDIAAGGSHTCGLLTTGKVRCWGRGQYGQLGYGSTGDIGDDETPASAGDVDVGGPVQQIVAGADHNCALLDTGTVRCWGRGLYGALGYGNTDDIGDDETPASAGDVDVGGPVAQLAAGDYHTCAILTTGVVRCWGQGHYGELGYGYNDFIGDNETPASAGDVALVAQ